MLNVSAAPSTVNHVLHLCVNPSMTLHLLGITADPAILVHNLVCVGWASVLAAAHTQDTAVLELQAAQESPGHVATYPRVHNPRRGTCVMRV